MINILSKYVITLRYIAFFLMLCIAIPHVEAKTENYPQWVLQTMNDGTYYYGVGMAYKQKKSTAHVIEAERLALQKLSENISFSLQSNSIMSQLDTDRKTKDELAAIIQVRTSNDVKGYEKVEVYESKREYWVLFRLSKELYRHNEREKHETTKAEALTLVLNALENERNNDIQSAIVGYAKALDVIKAYSNTTNNAMIDGKEIDIIPFAYNKVSSIIKNINITPAKSSYTVVKGKALDSIACTVSYNGRGISNMYVSAQFVNTNLANILSKSDNNGTTYFSCSKFYSTNTNNKAIFSLDLNSLFEAYKINYIVRQLIAQIKTNSAETNINISIANIYLSCSEKNIGRLMQDKILYEPFCETISAMGYNITYDRDEADYFVNIYADTKYVRQLDGLYYSSLTMRIEILDRDGSSIMNKYMPETRGVNTSITRAGLNAFYQSRALIANRYSHFILNALNK